MSSGAAVGGRMLLLGGVCTACCRGWYVVMADGVVVDVVAVGPAVDRTACAVVGDVVSS